MKNNICKFVTDTSKKPIITTNFVLENNLELLKNIEHMNYYSMRIVLNGTGKLLSDHIIGKLKPGTIFLTFPNSSCSIEASENFQCMYISFHGPRTQELFQRFRISRSNCIFEDHNGLLAFWQNCLGKAGENNLDLISESVLLYSFAQLSPAAVTGKQRLVDNILEYIEKNFNDASLNLTTLAEDLGYNPKYISKVFKEEIGSSFTEYVKNTRMQYAVFLLEHGVTTVKNLAFLCGFTDPYYFSNVFKEVVGMSPSKYIGILSEKKWKNHKKAAN